MKEAPNPLPRCCRKPLAHGLSTAFACSAARLSNELCHHDCSSVNGWEERQQVPQGCNQAQKPIDIDAIALHDLDAGCEILIARFDTPSWP